jgi:hypothetical protein
VAQLSSAVLGSPVEVSAHSRWQARAGVIITAVVGLFLAFDTTVKLLGLPQAVDATVQLGYAASAVTAIGFIEAICLVLYLTPRTSVLGALLLTGYLGGAVASQLRAGTELFGYVLFPIYVGVLVWAGLFLRAGRVRAVVPFTGA